MLKNSPKKTGVIITVVMVTTLLIPAIGTVPARMADPGFTKTVWNPDAEEWQDTLDVDVGDVIRFNITVNRTGNGILYDIKIKDMLPPCLQYNNGSTLFINTHGHEPQEIIGNIIYWNFTDEHQLVLDSMHPTLSIEFDATVLSPGDTKNEAELTATSDTVSYFMATNVSVNIRPFQFDKQVKNGDAWADETVALFEDFVRFNLSLTYYGETYLSDIRIVDTLPEFLEYAATNPEEDYINVSEDNKTIWFNLTTNLLNLKSVHIEFDAVVTEIGPTDGENTVTVTAMDNGTKSCESYDVANIVIVVNEPPATPAKPDGEQLGYEGIDYWFSTSTTDPNGDLVYYKFNWGDGNVSEWLGPVSSGDTVYADHAWTDDGVYLVAAKAKDHRGAESNWTDPFNSLIVIIYEEGQEPPENNPPEKPTTPSGDAAGDVDEILTFSTNTTDPDGNDVYYMWDWDDGTYSDWLGPYPSGETIATNHSWDSAGTYHIKVKARDVHYAESAISSSKTVTISGGEEPPEPESNVSIKEIKGGLGVKVVVQNTGDEDIEDITWKISIESARIFFTLLDVSDEGTIDLDAGDETEVKLSERVVGLGRITIDAQVKRGGTVVDSETVEGFIIGILVILS